MNAKRVAALAGLVGLFGGIGKVSPDLILGTVFTDSLPSWVPLFGTVGVSVTVYTYAADILGIVLLLGLAVGCGYYAGRQVDLRYDYWSFIKAIVGGTTLPLVVAWIVSVGAFVLEPLGGFSLLLVTTLLLQIMATVSLPVSTGLFAGAALAHFRSATTFPSEPATADSNTPSAAK